MNHTISYLETITLRELAVVPSSIVAVSSKMACLT